MGLPDNDRGRPDNDRGRPVARTTSTVAAGGDDNPTLRLADLDTLAEHLRGRFVVQVVIDADRGHRRTFVYRTCAAAERAVVRARERGQTAHVTLVQMLPVGVVTGLGVVR